MKTFMAKSETVERKWYVIDAEGLVLGRVASQVASILRGKNKPTFTPHVDTGDFVIVLNTDKIVLTGNKAKDKKYYRVSKRAGHLKEFTYGDLLSKRSDFMFMLSVKGMLPKNSLGRQMIKKLRVYKGGEHKQQAQQPVELKLV
ncbi:MAG: 50S ribosomal protein L13 [Clostridia bacterium]